MSTMFENHYYAEHTGKTLLLTCTDQTQLTATLIWAEADVMCIQEEGKPPELLYKHALLKAAPAPELVSPGD